MVKPKEVFVDAAHVKACANNKKVTTEIVKQEALFYEEQLETEMKVGLTFAYLNLKKVSKNTG